MAQPLRPDATAQTPAVRSRIVLVDADPASLRVAAAAVIAAGGALSPSLAPDVLRGGALADADLAIVDIPDAAALELVELLAGQGLAVVATSGAGSVALAVEAMRRGAVDFVLKPYSPDALARRLAPRMTIRRSAPPPADEAGRFGGFVGESPSMKALYAQIERIAPSRAPVFVTGESGSGKELCAEAIHAYSARPDGPFVALNCGAIPRELMESEVFGHVRGAFTGATEDRAGAAEAASGGTLFLDEIGEMELALQAKLLRFLQTGEFRRVGEVKIRRADIRIVCATHRDPLAEIAAGRFRQDLFYRLHVLPLHLPRLRDRGSDIIALAEAFLIRFAAEEGRSFRRFAPEVEAILLAHDWPGNVRELQNVVRRAVVLGDGVEVTRDMLPPEFSARTPAPAVSDSAGVIEPFWLQERRIIERAVTAFGGNTARAAAALEISPSTIYRKRERWQDGAAG